jgi:hypothetical protein
MFGRSDDNLEKLISSQHEESMAYLRQRDEEMRREFRRRDEEMREFNREILLRNEKVYTAMIAQLEENTEQMRSNTEQTRSNTEETRAQTQALLRVIDRLDGRDDDATAVA